MSDNDLKAHWETVTDPAKALNEFLDNQEFIGTDPYYRDLNDALWEMLHRAAKHGPKHKLLAEAAGEDQIDTPYTKMLKDRTARQADHIERLFKERDGLAKNNHNLAQELRDKQHNLELADKALNERNDRIRDLNTLVTQLKRKVSEQHKEIDKAQEERDRAVRVASRSGKLAKERWQDILSQESKIYGLNKRIEALGGNIDNTPMPAPQPATELEWRLEKALNENRGLDKAVAMLTEQTGHLSVEAVNLREKNSLLYAQKDAAEKNLDQLRSHHKAVCNAFDKEIDKHKDSARTVAYLEVIGMAENEFSRFSELTRQQLGKGEHHLAARYGAMADAVNNFREHMKRRLEKHQADKKKSAK